MMYTLKRRKGMNYWGNIHTKKLLTDYERNSLLYMGTNIYKQKY